LNGSDLIKREKKKNIGQLQWPDGGTMARLGPSSPEFIDTVTPGIIEQKEGMGR
jgi:hypothetical protein